MSKHQLPGGRRVLLLALLGIAAVAGVIAWPGGSSEADAAAPASKAPATETTFEIKPVLMRGTIASASWRDGPADATRVEDEQDSSARRNPLWEDARATERREKYERSIEDTVAPLEGLGVYVAPAESREGSR